MWYTLIAASFLHLLGAFITYNTAIKASSWYLPAGMLAGMASTVLWFSVVKMCTDNKELFIYGLAWDALLMAAYMLVPLLLFHVNLDWKQILGTILVVAGLILTKL
jgi:hypothetical protein